MDKQIETAYETLDRTDVPEPVKEVIRQFLTLMGYDPGEPASPPAPAAPAPARAIARSDDKAIGEAWALSRLPKIMGANPAHVENVRARMAAGQPVGVLTSERKAEVRALKARPVYTRTVEAAAR